MSILSFWQPAVAYRPRVGCWWGHQCLHWTFGGRLLSEQSLPFEAETLHHISITHGLCRWENRLQYVMMMPESGQHSYIGQRCAIISIFLGRMFLDRYRNACLNRFCSLLFRRPFLLPNSPKSHWETAYETRIPGVRPTKLQLVNIWFVTGPRAAHTQILALGFWEENQCHWLLLPHRLWSFESESKVCVPNRLV